VRRTSQVLILVNHTPKDKYHSLNYGEFQRQVQQEVGENVGITMAGLKEFRFDIGAADTKICIPERDVDVRDFNLVVFRLWSQQPERAAAMTHYLRHEGIEYVDSSTAAGRGSKAAQAMARWLAGIPVPRTVFASNAQLRQYMEDPNAELAFPCVLKSVSGRKGRDNYLIRDITQMRDVLDQNPDVDFMLQQYIPHEGDYRFIVFGRFIRSVIHRIAGAHTHLSNTSQGGDAELCQAKDFSKSVRHDVLRVASMEGIQMAGVDVMFDQDTGRHYILEVNRSPQILTGAFADEKLAAFGRFLKNHAVRTRKPRKTIGRHVPVMLPTLSNLSLTSKVDTGAYRNALHAEDIQEKNQNGVPTLFFSVPLMDGTVSQHSTTQFKSTKVRQSGSGKEKRYFIYADVRIDGRDYSTVFTLTDRKSMKYPLLLGRKLLRHNFVVDVSITEGVF
jgi:glutathione synthase/RimK-type ligase-like ATP-grasp enzyme